MLNNNIARKNKSERTIEYVNSWSRTINKNQTSKKSDSDYYAMSNDLVDKLTGEIKNKDKEESVLVIDDLGLQVINKLWEEGYRKITLCLTRLPDEIFDIVKTKLHLTFRHNIDIVKLSDIIGD